MLDYSEKGRDFYEEKMITLMTGILMTSLLVGCGPAKVGTTMDSSQTKETEISATSEDEEDGEIEHMERDFHRC